MDIVLRFFLSGLLGVGLQGKIRLSSGTQKSYSVSWVFDLTWSHRRLVTTNQGYERGIFARTQSRASFDVSEAVCTSSVC